MSECPDKYIIKYNQQLGHNVVSDVITKHEYNLQDEADLILLIREMNRTQDQIYKQRRLLIKISTIIDGLNDDLIPYYELSHLCAKDIGEDL